MNCERRFNLRPLLLFAISIICGEAVSYYSPSLGGYGVLILAGVFSGPFVLSEIFLKSRTRFSRAVVAGICLLLSVLGYGRFYYSVLKTEADKVPSGNYTVSGVVSDISVNDDGKTVFLSECRYDGVKGGNILLYGLDGVNVGDRLSVKCRAYPTALSKDGKFTYSAIIGASMQGANVYSVTVTGFRGGIFYTVRQAIKRGLTLNDGGVASKIAIAIMIGDTSALSAEELTTFRLGGIAHIFAVSGMHVGLLFAALLFVLEPLKLKRRYKSVGIFIVLLLYSGVCGFSSSSMRAVFMCGCMLLSETLGEKHDRINALSVAAIIISLTDPTSVVRAGFILSFAVCFSLITVSPPISRKTAFLGSKFSRALSALVAAELAIFPLSIIYFGYMPAVGLLLNLIVLPVVTIVYYFLWIGLLFNSVLPFWGVGLTLPYAALDGIYSIAAKFLGGVTATQFPSVLFLPYYIALVIFGDLINAKKGVKAFSSGVIVAIIIVSAFA